MIPGNINTDLISGADEVGYQISRSLRFNSADSAYLSRTPASAGNRKTWTWSGWFKNGVSGFVNPAHTYMVLFGVTNGTNASTWNALYFNNVSRQFYFADWAASYFISTAVFRDASSWMHVLLSVDTTQVAAANQVKLYINGVLQDGTRTAITQNTDLPINNNVSHNIGADTTSQQDYLYGYLADIHFIDGQALTPSSFAETNATTGQWVPKAYTGSYGTNGFRLDFSDNSAATATTLGKDYSGNSNNWTPNNLSVTAGAGNDSLVDTPTSYGTNTGVGGEVRGNYCTWNPLIKSTYATISNGNLNIVSSNNHGQTLGTIGVQSGKWYWEVDKSTSGNPATAGLGVMQQEYKQDATWVGNGVGRNYIYLQGGVVFWYDGAGSGSFSNTSLVNDTGIWMFAIDLDAQKMWIGKNGTWYSNAGSAITGPSSGSNAFFTSFIAGGTYFPFHNSDSTAVTYVANFGQRPFAYTAPSGFKALCDTNLPAPVVAKPSSAFDVVTYTGNGSARSITLPGGFSPDLVWIKSRSQVLYHFLVDTVRGNTKTLSSNTTDGESFATETVINSFDSSGFTLNADDGAGYYGWNMNGASLVAWTWDAGSSTVANTQGSITSQVRANASAGFSIVTWSYGTVDATVGHGLGVAPSMIIAKARTGTSQWIVYHSGIGTDQYIYLSSTAAAATNIPGVFSSNSSTVFEVNSGLFPASVNYVAYCFAPVAGYSSFGSYVGNGSADGPFIFLGFRPKLLWVKRTNTSSDWWIYDTSRSPYNVLTKNLYTNSASAEDDVPAAHSYDFVSNGFKVRMGYNPTNNNGDTYIYAAFAENPFQYARAR